MRGTAPPFSPGRPCWLLLVVAVATVRSLSMSTGGQTRPATFGGRVGGGLVGGGGGGGRIKEETIQAVREKVQLSEVVEASGMEVRRNGRQIQVGAAAASTPVCRPSTNASLTTTPRSHRQSAA